MIPIYEQQTGNGIGHSQDTFMERFEEICRQHFTTGRAQSFAFIFYDFGDKEFRSLLDNQGVFAKLDRLSGTRLSLFYLHANTKNAIKSFNSKFISKLGIDAKVNLPCIVFFKFNDGSVSDIEVVTLESPSLIHGFMELYEIVRNYLDCSESTDNSQPRAMKIFKSTAKFIGIETFRVMLKKGLELIM